MYKTSSFCKLISRPLVDFIKSTVPLLKFHEVAGQQFCCLKVDGHAIQHYVSEDQSYFVLFKIYLAQYCCSWLFFQTKKFNMQSYSYQKTDSSILSITIPQIFPHKLFLLCITKIIGQKT